MIEFKKYKPNDELDSTIAEFFSIVPFGRYLTDTLSDHQKGIDFEVKNLEAYGQTGELYFSYRGSRLVGVMGFRKSGWDSDHFQSNLAKISYFLVSDDDKDKNKISHGLMQKFEEWTTKEEIQLIIAKIDTSHFTPVVSLQKAGFIFYECITQRILKNATIFGEEDLSGEYRYALEEDLPSLKSIASKSTFKKSHFYLDEDIPTEKVDSLYEKWIESAFKSDSKIIVIEDEGKIAGMFIFRINGFDEVVEKNSATWEFAAVSPDFRSKGIGRKIFKCVLHACINSGAEIIETTLIEKNIISQKIHEQLGFRLLNTYYTFHKWL